MFHYLGSEINRFEAQINIPINLFIKEKKNQRSKLMLPHVHILQKMKYVIRYINSNHLFQIQLNRKIATGGVMCLTAD